MSGNPKPTDVDEAVLRLVDEQIENTFAERPDDVSGADESPHYAIVRESGGLCMRGDDRLTVSCYS